MQASDRATESGFRRVEVLVLLLVFLAGALFVGYSLETRAPVASTVEVINIRKPMNVLVAVQGTPLYPGFLGFVAVVRPNSQILTVVPIPSEVPVRFNHSRMRLYQAVSDATAVQAMHLITRATHVPIDHYFYLNSADLDAILQVLYSHSPHWPANRTPLTMLKTLGYPKGRTVPSQQMRLLRTIVNQLPTINPLYAGALLGIPKTSVTNLTLNQLFVLGNYVRGDKLVQGSVTHYRHFRRKHG